MLLVLVIGGFLMERKLWDLGAHPYKWKRNGPISKRAENQWLNRVLVDLSLNQAASPWFHQYLDPAWYHLWRLVSENVHGEYMGYKLLIHGVHWGITHLLTFHELPGTSKYPTRVGNFFPASKLDSCKRWSGTTLAPCIGLANKLYSRKNRWRLNQPLQKSWN